MSHRCMTESYTFARPQDFSHNAGSQWSQNLKEQRNNGRWARWLLRCRRSSHRHIHPAARGI